MLKAAIATMRARSHELPSRQARHHFGISAVQVLGHYASSNVIRCAWLAEVQTLAFALGDRGIHRTDGVQA